MRVVTKETYKSLQLHARTDSNFHHFQTFCHHILIPTQTKIHHHSNFTRRHLITTPPPLQPSRQNSQNILTKPTNKKDKKNTPNHLDGDSVVRVWDKEVCSLCGLRFEPCGCSYDGHWRLTWSLTSGPVGLVEVRASWPGHPR